MATIMPTFPTPPLTSLNPASITAGTGAYTIPAGYHGFLQASTSAAAASGAGGHAAPSFTSYSNTTAAPTYGLVGAFTSYYGMGAGNGSGSASSNDINQWLPAGTTITPASAGSGTTSADAYAQITISAGVASKSVAKGYAQTSPVMVGSGLAGVAAGWSVALFVN